MSQPITLDLPPPDKIVTEEIPVIGATLKSTAVYLGKYCDDFAKEYMLCKREEQDPRKCLGEGKQLTACGLDFYRKLKRTCRPEVEAYALCIDQSDGRYPLNICMKNRGYFDDCMKDKMGMERPEHGYFSQVRAHKSNRPKPEYKFKRFEVAPALPEDYVQGPPAAKEPIFQST